MSKQWTRNYDNLFSAIFGTTNITHSVLTTPSENTPCFKSPSGKLFTPKKDESGNLTSLLCQSAVIVNPSKYLTDATASFTGIGFSVIGLGKGVTPPSYEDYCLENPIYLNMEIGNVTFSWVYDEETHIYTKTYKIPIVNTGADPVEVSEFGIFCCVPYSSNPNSYPVLVYRETLDTTFTLEQNDTIEITFSQSIMQPNYTPYPVVE